MQTRAAKRQSDATNARAIAAEYVETLAPEGRANLRGVRVELATKAREAALDPETLWIAVRDELKKAR